MESRLARRLLAVLALGVGLWCALLAWRWSWFIDLRVYELGAGALFGGDLYGVRFHVADLPFTYPPFAAVLMLPLAVLPTWLSAFLWSLACVVVLARVVDLTLRACGTTPTGLLLPAVVAVALLAEPVWSTFSFGQVNLFLMAAVLADVLRPERKHAGWLVGLVAGIKLTPLFFVAFLLVIGRRRAAGTAVASFAATVLVGAVAAPRASWAYWTDVLWDPGRVGGVEYAGNQSVLGILSRALGHEAPTLLWFAVAGTTAAAALLAAALVWRSASPAARPLAACTAAYGMLLASPISWDHHWVWLVPTAIALWHSGLSRARVVAGVVAVVAFSRAIWWAPFRNGKEYDWGLFASISGNAYVLVALLLIGATLVWGVAAARATRGAGSVAEGDVLLA
ncbi:MULTISPECIES: glycosyltransferase 87 family protein [unclassified Nocardioides]|uniref:glycosyltransferase 87 family protein n=1 Tax=unclassified Nocardioides TaxID=2615069 RepID=UPI0007034263|nr:MULTISPECIES: glycosyltransferase 87 family protein [unclassified Nocardioides]KRC46100.1 hypothetical protein ASE19_19680 [Nocardioides sp. Root79]KRC69448.1 hypothetical protein ASE20_12535 [Nocardioides sp. Root240]